MAGGAPDNSLFGYCLATFGAAGFLACDDGSMELADFVHIADDDTVTLIHVKGAHSTAPNRVASPPAYEVVTGQAVKNLRHLDRIKLADALERNAANAIAAATWHNGNRQPNRSTVIARAKALPENHARRLIILQPQVSKTEHDACLGGTASQARQLRMKQLNTLLLAARLSAHSVGATFEVWSAKV